MKALKRLVMSLVLFLAPIAAAMAADVLMHSEGGNSVRLFKTPCAIPGIEGSFAMNGAPPVGARRAVVVMDGTTLEACWVEHDTPVPHIDIAAQEYVPMVISIDKRLFKPDSGV